MTIGLRSRAATSAGSHRVTGWPAATVRLLGGEQLEAVPLEPDRVDAQVHEHARALRP